MRPRITTKNINYFIRQTVGIKTAEKLFEYGKEHSYIQETTIKQIIEEFSGYRFRDGKLKTYNPYTNKFESLQINGVDHIQNKDDLMKELSMLHKTRMLMLKQSRTRIVELSKKKKRTRDKDLDIHIERSKTQQNARLASLKKTDISITEKTHER